MKKSEPPTAPLNVTQLERAKDCVRVLSKNPLDKLALELLSMVLAESQDKARDCDHTIDPAVWFELHKFYGSLLYIERACFDIMLVFDPPPAKEKD